MLTYFSFYLDYLLYIKTKTDYAGFSQSNHMNEVNRKRRKSEYSYIYIYINKWKRL
nr:MAG TPA: hypothetical protein [Caudoviricetes sp.]